MNELRKLSSFCRTHFHTLMASVLLCDFLAIYPDMFYYFGPPKLLSVSKDTFLDHILSGASESLHLELASTLQILWAMSLLSFGLLFFTRTRTWGAISSWIFLNIWLSSHNISLDGSHAIMAVFLFILCLGLLLKNEPLFFRWGKIFLCLIYFNAGYSKLMDGQWRSGELLWNLSSALLVKYSVLSTSYVSHLFPLLFVGGWFVILSQLLAPTILLRPKLRSFFCISEVLIHVFIIFTLKFYLFSLLMILLNLTFFSANDLETPREQTVK